MAETKEKPKTGETENMAETLKKVRDSHRKAQANIERRPKENNDG